MEESVYIYKSNLFKLCKRINVTSSLGIFILLSGTLLSISARILLVTVYLPPEGSPFYTDEINGILMLEAEIANALVTLDRDIYVILTGDRNVRTGNQLDFLYDDSVDKIPSSEWLTKDKLKKPRNSCNSNDTINNFTRNLIWLCQLLDIHIVNGPAPNEKEGHFTCLTSNGTSVVDYFIVSSELFKYISDFVVFPEQFSASVHLPIICNFKTTHCDQCRAKSKDYNLPNDKSILGQLKIQHCLLIT